MSLKLDDPVTICGRCSQLCFDPIEIVGGSDNYFSIKICFRCLEEAMERSGGKIERGSQELILLSHAKMRTIRP